MKPLIAISISRELGPDQVYRDFLRATYLRAVVQAGGVPVMLPNISESAEALLHCDGLLLTGGGDFDPASYGAAEAGTHVKGISADRDRTEVALVHTAMSHNIPVFGICRGIQALAVADHGTLVQDVPTVYPESPLHHNQSEARAEVTHSVNMVPGSLLSRITDSTALQVNSFHHQSLETLPAGWVVAAESEDGVIEAIEHPDYAYGIGVQWHPEDLVGTEEGARRLFAAFVAAADAYRKEKHANG
jgi:putative glutamine amidotransferase